MCGRNEGRPARERGFASSGWLLAFSSLDPLPDDFQARLNDDPPTPPADVTVRGPFSGGRLHFIAERIARVEAFGRRSVSAAAHPCVQTCGHARDVFRGWHNREHK